MRWRKSERAKWALPLAATRLQPGLGLPALDPGSQALYGEVLPRGVPLARLQPDRPPVNRWMSPIELAQYSYAPGQIILGKLAGRFLGLLDDRPQITIAGARAGKTSTVIEPNLYLYPGSMLVLDPKGELSRTAALRQALGHRVFVLDAFRQSGVPSASFNILDELDPEADTIIDDVASITQALIIDDGDAKARHWNDNARTLLTGIVLLTLTFPAAERHLVTVRELLCLQHPSIVGEVEAAKRRAAMQPANDKYFNENTAAITILLRAMIKQGRRFGGILAAIGNRYMATPFVERGNIISTASTQTDFLDSLPLRAISRRSDFGLAALRDDRPTTIYLCLPVGRMQSHFRWLRLIVQMACTVLEQMGTYPRERTPILFLMEEFATLGHMEIMERAAAYFPGFGIKLWAILQDTTQLQRNYSASWETFLGNAGLVQCFANGDQNTLDYLSERLEKLMAPFELRMAFSRRRFSQMLLIEGEPPAAAMRLGHEDVSRLRERCLALAAQRLPLQGP